MSHLKQLKRKCLESANLRNDLSRKSWGSDKECLLRLYNALVRSKLDYGAPVYGSAQSSDLQMLDPVHHLGLRLATGDFRTLPPTSLYGGSHQMSLNKLRCYRSFRYWLCVMSCVSHPTYKCVPNLPVATLFENKPSIIRPFSMRMEGYDCLLLRMSLTSTSFLPYHFEMAPWVDA